MYELAKKSLNEIPNMDDFTITKKLVCVGEDGAAMMQGHRNNLCEKLQMSIAPYMVLIHWMAHRLNLPRKIVHGHEEVVRVDELIHELYAYFYRSPKFFFRIS